MIKNLHRDGNQWFWHTADNRGVYYTNTDGEGIFFQSSATGNTKQIMGTCQFKSCQTVSGTRRKINAIFDEYTEDPRI